MFIVSNIPCDEFELVWKFFPHPLDILNFNVGVIKAVEIVEADDSVPFLEELFTKMGTDKACSARNQDDAHLSPIILFSQEDTLLTDRGQTQLKASQR